MTQEALKLALDMLELCNGAETVDGVVLYTDKEIAAIKEALAEHAMKETQRLGQEIEQKIGCVNHDCDQCKAQPEQEPVAWLDGPHLVVRSDMRERLNYKGPWVDLGRAIPDKWTPLLYTHPPQPAQEPVAIVHIKEWIEYLKRKSDFGQHMKIPSEMSAGACWELAIELEQFINTTPPQRTETLIGCVNHDCEKCKAQTQAPVAHCKVRLLRGDESFPKVEIDWVNQPIRGPLYTFPPQRKPLSAEQVSEICAAWTDENGNTGSFGRRQIARAIEAAHGIKGEA